MIIQCQHCNANFKIDKDKIPSKKSYVRCAKCSNLISLGGAPEVKTPAVSNTVEAACTRCGAKYAVPLSKFKADALKVKCGKCGLHFNVSKIAPVDEKKTETSPSEQPPVKTVIPDVPKRINIVKESTSIATEDVEDNIDVSKEEVDDIFSDFTQDYDENEGVSEFGEESEFSDLGLDDDIRLDETPNSVEEDSNRAYLESIQLSTDDDIELDDIGGGSIPVSQKSKFFLSTENKNEIQDLTEESTWPEIQDETKEDGVSEDPFQKDILETSVELGGGLESVSSSSKEEQDNPSRLIPALILFVVLVVALGSFGWYFVQQRSLLNHKTEGFSEEYNQQSKLQILEPLKGKYVKNKALKQKIFVLQGKIKNFYDGTDKVSQVEVEGLLYDDKNTVLSEARAYAGTYLTLSQLENLKISQIKSVIASHSDSAKGQLDLGFNQVIPFQIIFFDIPDKVDKLEARILRFSKRK